MKQSKAIFCLSLLSFFSCWVAYPVYGTKSVAPVDYVNPYMGNISHLLVPTFPMIHLPNNMLRVTPQRGEFTAENLDGLPIVLTSHRGRSCFNLSPFQGEESALRPVMSMDYDNEHIKPYYYTVDIDHQQIDVEFAPGNQAAIYRLNFLKDKPTYLIVNSGNGEMTASENTIQGYQHLWNNTRVFLYLETDQHPRQTGVLENNQLNKKRQSAKGDNAAIVFNFGEASQCINIRYGVSFISIEQAKKNLRREIRTFDLKSVALAGRRIWNEALGKIQVHGDNYNDLAVFYTSFYRFYERPVNCSEDGYYFCASDGKVHANEGREFYTDDWIWDTYRAAHPLRLLIDEKKETAIIHSFLRMAEQSKNKWLPTFPEINGDSRRMNCNHGVATIADAWCKGVKDFDLTSAYDYSRRAIEEKTLAPWSSKSAGWLDDFYKNNGYIPALKPGEEETVPEVDHFEKRQAVAVTLGTAYDQWCLSQIAEALGKREEATYYLRSSYNYRNLFNHQTSFFHPKDKHGAFIIPFDYRFSGGLGARHYYAENNGWIYRWDVQHNIGDLVNLMGGRESFTNNLNQLFSEWLGKSKYEFYSQLPDHTGNVGQYSMANEPALHIPYLYNYAGQPWQTQKHIRSLIKQWFRNDLMGLPGDEDGGGLSSFVVFSQMGFYPVTPGSPTYNIGSPFFPRVSMTLSNGKKFEIIAKNCSDNNKYIQSAKLNGKVWNNPWFSHSDIINGGKLELVMGSRSNPEWGSRPEDTPPSARPYPKND